MTCPVLCSQCSAEFAYAVKNIGKKVTYPHQNYFERLLAHCSCGSFFIVNNYYKIAVYIFFNDRSLTKCQTFYMTTTAKMPTILCYTPTGILHDSGGSGFEPHWILWVFFFFFFVSVSLGKALQNPSLVLVKSRKDMNNVSCRRDMNEILLKAA